MKMYKDFLSLLKKHPLAIAIFSCISTIPLILYFYKFHEGLSSQESAWSTFGTFIGGVYGPVFTLLSVVVLVATLLEISESNRKAFELTNSSYTLTEIKELTKILSDSIDNKEFIKQGGRFYCFSHFGREMKIRFKTSPPDVESDIWDASVGRFAGGSSETFRDELSIIYEILLRIHNIHDVELKERAQVIFKAIIPNHERYWLECYIRKHDNSTFLMTKMWTPFSSIPSDLLSMLVKSTPET